MKRLLAKIKATHNKNVQVVIGKPLMRWGRELFDDGYPILRYPSGTKLGRIFIDIGLCKSWSQFDGTHWKNYDIPKGFTDLLLDGLKVQKYDMADRDDLSGFTPHRVSILNLSKNTTGTYFTTSSACGKPFELNTETIKEAIENVKKMEPTAHIMGGMVRNRDDMLAVAYTPGFHFWGFPLNVDSSVGKNEIRLVMSDGSSKVLTLKEVCQK